MAGITAASISATVASGDTAADKNATGFIKGERVTLATSPTGTSYSWGIAWPSDATARSNLTSTTAAAPSFLLEKAGYYTIDCTVDGTDYKLRISVTEPAVATVRNAVNYQPVADTNVPTPVAGVTVYYSSTQSALAYKDTAGDIYTIDSTVVP